MNKMYGRPTSPSENKPAASKLLKAVYAKKVSNQLKQNALAKKKQRVEQGDENSEKKRSSEKKVHNLKVMVINQFKRNKEAHDNVRRCAKLWMKATERRIAVNFILYKGGFEKFAMKAVSKSDFDQKTLDERLITLESHYIKKVQKQINESKSSYDKKLVQASQNYLDSFDCKPPHELCPEKKTLDLNKNGKNTHKQPARSMSSYNKPEKPASYIGASSGAENKLPGKKTGQLSKDEIEDIVRSRSSNLTMPRSLIHLNAGLISQRASKLKKPKNMIHYFGRDPEPYSESE
jgi:hypothetical protein